MSGTRVEIRLAGSGGQGLITGMQILFRALALEGRRAAQSQSYEPTSRGGFCYSDLVVSDDGDDYPLATKLDMVAARHDRRDLGVNAIDALIGVHVQFRDETAAHAVRSERW